MAEDPKAEVSFSTYYRADEVAASVNVGEHRNLVGGMWDEIGRLQFDALAAGGLRPDHRLLDIGCGSLRGGVHFVRFLEPDHYYGLDLNQPLLDAGYERELGPLGLQGRLSRDHLIADGMFDVSRFDVMFDRAVAVSLFTHLPMDMIRVCLERLATKMKKGGIFYATFFETPESQPSYIDITHERGGVVSHGGSDPFHQRIEDFDYLCLGLPWKVRFLGDFGHPRNQMLISFTRED